MEYIHQSTYGHAGGFHTAKPIMAMDRARGAIYDMKGGRPDTSKPLYNIRDNHAFATSFHPGGASQHSVFEIRGDKIHTTVNHPNHNPTTHTFEVRGMQT